MCHCWTLVLSTGKHTGLEEEADQDYTTKTDWMNLGELICSTVYLVNREQKLLWSSAKPSPIPLLCQTCWQATSMYPLLGKQDKTTVSLSELGEGVSDLVLIPKVFSPPLWGHTDTAQIFMFPMRTQGAVPKKKWSHPCTLFYFVYWPNVIWVDNGRYLSYSAVMDKPLSELEANKDMELLWDCSTS